MKTIRTKVYQFSELSDKAKDTAVSELSDINVMHDWYQFTYEDAAQIGLKLTSFDLDRKECNGYFMLAANEVAQNILNNHGDICETYRTAQSFMEEWQPVFNNYMDETHADYESNESEAKMQDMEENFLQSLLEDYRIMLGKELEYLYSEKAIIETIEANEYYFTQDGKIFNK